MAADETPPPYAEGWPQWINGHRYHIVAFFFLLVVVLYAWLVYMSGRRILLPTEQVALALTTMFLSAIVGVLLGEVLVVRKANIASQLRRAYGVKQAVRALQRNLGDARERMAQRQGLDSQSITTLWEEILLHVQSELRLPMAEADRMIDDWGELDPGTRNRIRQEEASKQSEIDDLYEELAVARTARADLGEVEDVVGQSLSATVTALEDRIRDAEQNSTPKAQPIQAGAAKLSAIQGQHARAIRLYDNIINVHPTAHTGYIGRARAKAMAGDVEGALFDLEIARRLNPADLSIGRLKDQIESGEPITAALPGTSEAAKHEVSAGNRALAAGDPETARSHYVNAGQLGMNNFFILLDHAMCSILDGDLTRAKSELGDLRAAPGSYVAVNKVALEAICACLTGEELQPILEVVQRAVESARPYSYYLSPLRFLEEGVGRTDPSRRRLMEPVVALLRAG